MIRTKATILSGNFLVLSSVEFIFPFAVLEDRSQIRTTALWMLVTCLTRIGV